MSGEPVATRKLPKREWPGCSFCGKPGSDVRSLICGQTPKVAICDECVALCNDIIAEEHAMTGDQPPPAA
jgi:hypothetical protein